MKNPLVNIKIPFLRTWQCMIVASLVLLAGCIQTAPIPGYARVGDQVVIGLGGIHHNAQSNYFLLPSDISATLTDSNGSVFNLAPGNTFKAFPSYLGNLTGNSVEYSGFGVHPFDGGWFVTLTIADAGNSGNSIAPGMATIKITSSKLTQTSVPGEGSYLNQKIEIISGTSAQGNFGDQFSYYGDGPFYAPIVPTNLTSLSTAPVGGAVIQISYSDESKLGTGAVVLPLAHHPYIQVTQSIKSNGNGGGILTAYIMNPYGFVPTASRQTKQSSLEDLSVALQWFTSQPGTVIGPTVTVSGYYFDLNGNTISGVTPQVSF